MNIVVITNNPHLIEALDQLVDPDLDYSDQKFDNYWCINIKPFVCKGCGNVVAYAECGNHLIVIWEYKDDDGILEVAEALKEDYDARIIRYDRFLGPCIDFEEAVKRGLIVGITHGD